MKLTLARKNLKPIKKDNITKIYLKDLVVINSETGEELEEKTGIIWCDKGFLTTGINSLLTPEHVANDPDNTDYLVIVIKCNEAIEL